MDSCVIINNACKELKYEYGEELQWVLPYPGDGHLLKNYQYALIKPYFDAGLKTLAKAAGYPVAAIQSCGQFKRTHHFILEAWEACYRTLLKIFMESREQQISECDLSSQQLQKEISSSIQLLSTTDFAHAFNKQLAS